MAGAPTLRQLSMRFKMSPQTQCIGFVILSGAKDLLAAGAKARFFAPLRMTVTSESNVTVH
jgi:hypothetical protein